mmetsp:Transcript_26213/g.30631  ORF Transcript_26213/g.30631 Transcript_26213/m.30631 type:complete len:164 (-) Transcript_26213:720-1211(-)
MINTAILAFFGEVVGAILQQWAFVMQKLAHRNLEQQQKRNLVENDYKEQQIVDHDGYLRQEEGNPNVDQAKVERDVDQTLKVYCSWRWLFGIVALIISVVIHSFMLPLLNLTLLAAKNVAAIVAATLFSTQILEEQFICRYDLPALLLISAGCVMIVLSANTT